MPTLDQETQIDECITDCQYCAFVCQNMAMGHCLEVGGKHAEPEHLKTMLVCAEICRATAFSMASGSMLHRQVCALCVDVCDACIKSCEELDGMDACINACERCKSSCEAMAAV